MLDKAGWATWNNLAKQTYELAPSARSVADSERARLVSYHRSSSLALHKVDSGCESGMVSWMGSEENVRPWDSISNFDASFFLRTLKS